MRKPRPLSPGDRILVPSPAGPVARPERWQPVAARVARRGYRLEPTAAAHATKGYLAGSDDERRTDLQAALDDPGAAAVVCSRGGYGSMRILRGLAVPDRVPPAFVGFSDITALHMWLARHDWVTFHGPMATTDLGLPRPHGPSERWLWGLLEGTLEPPLEIRASPLRPGRARGRLLGGNLTLLASLAGTRYLPSFQGAILVVEDVGEEPYRVDRMLTQLGLAGALDGLAGLAVGGFTWPGMARDRRDRRTAEVQRLMRDLAEELRIPAVTGLPFGHQRHNLALPLGVEAEVDADHGRLVVCEDWLQR